MKTKSAQSVAELREGPGETFGPLAERFGSVWLDSSLQSNGMGAQSFIASQPLMDICQINGRVSSLCLVTGRPQCLPTPMRNMGQTAGMESYLSQHKDSQITIAEHQPATDADSADSILEVVQTLCQEQGLIAIGYITFEATLPGLGLNCTENPLAIPEARFLLYDSVRRFDHNDAEHPTNLKDKSARISGELAGLPPVSVRSGLSKDDYLAKVKTIKQHIKEGDIYQANFTTRFEVSGAAEPFQVYQRLRRYNPAPYAAYLNFGDYQILSSSPERMFLLKNDHIATSPIKGTIMRGHNDTEDRMKLKSLLESEKDRAELLMIVDLERNDLGKLARPGTVRVEELFEPLRYSSVFHLAANVSATLRPDVSMSDVIEALLPGGSISGAPKKRAVEIIRRLETVPRLVYTGCIGYIDGRTADFNIAIRTMLHHNGCYHVHAGGGIVADSEPEEEYREMLLKAGNLFRALGADPEKIAQ